MTKRGRPPIYDSEMCDEMIDLMEKGSLDCQIYAKWNITRETFYCWKRTHPEFKEAHEIGLVKWEAWLMTQFQGMMSGDLSAKHAFNACISLANNKLGWARKDQGTTNTYQISNINVLQTKNANELLDFVVKELRNQDLIGDAEFKLIEPTGEEQSRALEDSGSTSNPGGEEEV